MPRIISSIKLFREKDPYPFKNKVEWYGFAAETTLGQIIDIAIQNNCNIITKNGGGKWYLKNENYSDALSVLNDNEKARRARFICYLIKYEDQDTL
jgi:hypothetical protein